MKKSLFICFVAVSLLSPTLFLLSQENRDSIRFMSRVSEAIQLASKDSLQALAALKKVRKMADSIDQPYYQLKAERLHIHFLEQWNQIDKADSLYDILITRARKLGDDQNLYAALAGKASLQYRLGRNGRALSYYYDALSIAVNRKDSLNWSRILNNISLVQNKLKDFEGSTRTLQKALELKEELQDTVGMATIYSNLGNVYVKMKRGEDALNAYRNAQRVYSSAGYFTDAQLINENIGQLYYQRDEFDLASGYLDSAITIREQMPLSLNYIALIAQRADIHNIQGEYREGLSIFLKIDTIIGDQSYPAIQKDLFKGLSQSYAGLGDYEKAYEYAEKRRSVEAELNASAEIEIQEKYEALFKSEEKDSQLKIQAIELQAEKDKSRFWSILGVAGFLLLLLAIIAVIAIRRRNEVLKEKNELTTRSLHERDILLREVHHRVKNNLQIISSMLSMQGRRAQDEELKREIRVSENRVRSMSLIHEHLYNVDELANIDMAEYLKELLQNLMISFPNHQVNIQTQIESIRLDIDTAVALGLIINESVTNSMKHAFKGEEKDRINIHLSSIRDIISLKIADNGCGFNPSERPHRSFGLTMIHAFTESLDGQLEMDSSDGTQLSIQFPLKQQNG